MTNSSDPAKFSSGKTSPNADSSTDSSNASTPVTSNTSSILAGKGEGETLTTPSAATPPPAVRQMIPSVGLINQGCTCYLNSLLQLLFHLSYFRSAVYRITLDRSDESALIPLALQELFFQMQERRTAPTTKGLTDAFGWDEREVFVQHDIQEMAALLRDCLESRMRGTPSEGATNRLFEGRGEQVVETLDGSYTSRSKDTFYDVHLPIQNFSTIEASLRSLIQKDQLVGDNKYKVEQEGKPPVYMDAQKGYRFVQFPPVIFFHLKRFEMDLMSPTLEMKKVNSAFEFAEELDLREFETGSGSREAGSAVDEFDRDSQPIYDLNGVIVHRGTARSGHYYCYIRHFDAVQGRFTHWLEYDDDNVRVVDSDIAVDSNFGGHRYATVHGRQMLVPNTNNAYILSYVRRADRAVVLAPTPTDVIPEHVKRELRRVMEADERKAAAEKIRRTQVRVVIATDDVLNQFVRANVVDLLPREERVSPSLCATVDVKKTDSFASLYSVISEQLGREQFPRSDIRLWKWTLSQDKLVYRPTHPLATLEEAPADGTVSSHLLSAALQEKDTMAHVLVYVERPTKAAKELFPQLMQQPPRAFRVFVKYMVARDNTLNFLGPLDLVKGFPLAHYYAELAAMMGVHPEQISEQTVSFVLEAARGAAPRLLDATQPTHLIGIVTGDILVLQPSQVKVAYRSLSAVDVIHTARNKRVIEVHDVASSEVVGSITILIQYDYDQVCEEIYRMLRSKGPHAKTPDSADYIQLYRNIDYYVPTPSEAPIRNHSSLTAWDMCHVNQYPTTHLFFTVLPHSRHYAEQNAALKVRLFRADHTVEKDVQVTAVMPASLQDIVKLAIAAPPVSSTKPASPDGKAPPQPGAGTDAEAVPTAAPCVSQHYVVQYAFESRSRPARLPVEVSMLPDGPPQFLNRPLCPGEWLFVTPSEPLAICSIQPGWHNMTSDSEEDTTPVSEDESASKQRRTAQMVRVPVSQGEYQSSASTAAFFGAPFYVDIDPLRATIQDVLDAALARNQLSSSSDEIMPHPMMLVVDDYTPDGEVLTSERDVDMYCYKSKHFRFTNLAERIYPFLQNHDDRYFVYLNRKRPKEKPGSRYVATNDPKLTLEKKRLPSAGSSSQLAQK